MGRMLRWLLCGLLVLNLYGIGVGLWSSLFGPEAQEGLFAVVSFLVGIIVFALVGHWFMWRQSSGESLGLVRNPRMAEALRKWFWRSFQVVFVTAGVTCAVMFTAGSAGVANETPILAPRHTYVLRSHGTKTEVSRAVRARRDQLSRRLACDGDNADAVCAGVPVDGDFAVPD